MASLARAIRDDNGDVIRWEYSANVQQFFGILRAVMAKLGHKRDDDLFQVGCVGLLKALRTYEEGQRASVSTWVYRVAYCAMVDELRHRARTENEVARLTKLANEHGFAVAA